MTAQREGWLVATLAHESPVGHGGLVGPSLDDGSLSLCDDLLRSGGSVAVLVPTMALEEPLGLVADAIGRNAEHACSFHAL